MTKREPVSEVIAEFFKKLAAETQVDKAVINDLEQLADQKKLADTPAVSTILRRITRDSNEAA